MFAISPCDPHDAVAGQPQPHRAIDDDEKSCHNPLPYESFYKGEFKPIQKPYNIPRVDLGTPLHFVDSDVHSLLEICSPSFYPSSPWHSSESRLLSGFLLESIFVSEVDSDDSDSAYDSDSDDEAQYISIPFDSPYYKPPSPSRGFPFPSSDSTYFDLTSDSPSELHFSCDESVVDIFRAELRRPIPDDDLVFELDERNLREMDIRSFPSPTDVFAEACLGSTHPRTFLRLHLDSFPDVPIDFMGADTLQDKKTTGDNPEGGWTIEFH